jgi:large subunit ribosomal protein LP1
MSIADLSPAQKQELATSLAVLLCHDAEVEVSAENLNAALKASKNKVDAFLPQLMADVIERGLKVEKLLAGPSAGAAAAPAAAGASGAAPAAAASKKEEKVEEEEADLGGGMDMFGGGSDY